MACQLLLSAWVDCNSFSLGGCPVKLTCSATGLWRIHSSRHWPFPLASALYIGPSRTQQSFVPTCSVPQLPRTQQQAPCLCLVPAASCGSLKHGSTTSKQATAPHPHLQRGAAAQDPKGQLGPRDGHIETAHIVDKPDAAPSGGGPYTGHYDDVHLLALEAVHCLDQHLQGN